MESHISLSQYVVNLFISFWEIDGSYRKSLCWNAFRWPQMVVGIRNRYS